jgi:hypothetical protein
MITTEEMAQKAIDYEMKTNEADALAFAKKEGLKEDKEIILAVAEIKAKRLYDTVAEAKAAARSSKEFLDWRERYENAIADWKLITNYRATQDKIWNTWRTEQANTR